MHGLKEIISEAESLPVQERAILVDSVLRTLNPPDPGLERRWIAEAKRRREELRSGRVQGIPADEVSAEIRERFDK